ncbi:MAG: DUF2292 domain-containing protein [Bacillota bacterium]|nr:DUF2292 domain-containing protein [Bacillota bacterium]
MTVYKRGEYQERRVSALALSRQEALERITRALDEFERGEKFGEITIRLQAGKVIWVDQFIRERVG